MFYIRKFSPQVEKLDRKSVVQGKSVDLGGRGIIKKKKRKEKKKKKKQKEKKKKCKRANSATKAN